MLQLLLLRYLLQQGVNAPGEAVPGKGIGIDLHLHPGGHEIKKPGGQEILKIAPDRKGIGQPLGEHPLHPLALDQKEFLGKQIPAGLSPQNLDQLGQ